MTYNQNNLGFENSSTNSSNISKLSNFSQAIVENPEPIIVEVANRLKFARNMDETKSNEVQYNMQKRKLDLNDSDSIDEN